MGLLRALLDAVLGQSKGSGIYVNGRELSSKELARAEAQSRKNAIAYKREQEQRAEALKELGVDIDALTEAKVVADSRRLIKRFAQDGFQLNKGMRPERKSVKFQKLTKAGNLPKIVARGQAVFDFSLDKSIVCNIRYLKDGSICDAELNEWGEDKERHQLGTFHKIKTVDGKLEEESIEQKRGEHAKDDMEYWTIGAKTEGR